MFLIFQNNEVKIKAMKYYCTTPVQNGGQLNHSLYMPLNNTKLSLSIKKEQQLSDNFNMY